MGKIILIEGTDCSGKETQSKMLMEYFKNNDISVGAMSFPRYETPTGRIIGGPLLGKPAISNTWFDKPMELDAKVASLYYAADRRAALEELKKLIKDNDVVILDRYTFSNMAHQGSKLKTFEERKEMYAFLETLEFKLLELPRPDLVIFLYLPYEYGMKIKMNRAEELDEAEKNEEHQINSERTYLELTSLYGFEKIDCFSDGNVRSREEIHEDVVKRLRNLIKK